MREKLVFMLKKYIPNKIRSLMSYIFFKSKGIRIGIRPLISNKIPIVNAAGKITVGDYFIVRCIQFKSSFSAFEHGELIIGDSVFINQGVTISCAKKILIGDNCKIADLACIYDTDFHEIDQDKGIKVKPVVLGKNVWIGRGSIILPGVEIGDHSVIGAGSVVSSSIPNNSLVFGNPAKVIRKIDCLENYIRK
jgi:acetyltransferase-like isoleucine patch superfamily enzyme